MFIKEKDLGRVALACISILKCLHRCAPSIELFIIHRQTKLELSVCKKTACLTLFSVKHINLYFFDGIAFSNWNMISRNL
jgi:hypothetical protein